ncbi:MAG: hypothetical protein K1X88_15140 [Nannocystaceae bacterium]|nr:hypothetical protein [Nannocystaceae bacterium]
MTLLAVRAIDVAIFGTLGGLWIGGAIFIVVLYRWIIRFERNNPPDDGASVIPTAPVTEAKDRNRAAVGLSAAVSR